MTFSHRLLEFSPCRHARLPRHLLHHPAAPPPGSSLREETAADSVTKIVSQCVGTIPSVVREPVSRGG
jgi:hypothetical protein